MIKRDTGKERKGRDIEGKRENVGSIVYPVALSYVCWLKCCYLNEFTIGNFLIYYRIGLFERFCLGFGFYTIKPVLQEISDT